MLKLVFFIFKNEIYWVFLFDSFAICMEMSHYLNSWISNMSFYIIKNRPYGMLC